jgi:DNA-binding transcriptional regulator YiaG
MSANQAFLEQDFLADSGRGTASGHLHSEEGFALGGTERFDPALIEREIAEHNLQLGSSEEIGEGLYQFVDRLADRLIDLPDNDPLRVDPYFLLSAQRATMAALRVLDSDDPQWVREQMRIRLEQLRQVFRDLEEGRTVYDTLPGRDVAAWLDRELDVSQARIAGLLGVSSRTFQRWVSPKETSAPDDDDARRLRVVAAAVNHLRHALSGPGVVSWLEEPNVRLDGRAPADLLGEPDAAVLLGTLAADTRSHSAF